MTILGPPPIEGGIQGFATKAKNIAVYQPFFSFSLFAYISEERDVNEFERQWRERRRGKIGDYVDNLSLVCVNQAMYLFDAKIIG